MNFSQVYGNEAVKKTLMGMADSGRVPHALLLYENEGCGALALALAFFRYLNCPSKGHDSCGECPACKQISHLTYPDMHFSFPITSGSKVDGAVKDLTCKMFSPYWKELLAKNPYFMENELGPALGFEKKAGAITVAEGKSIIRDMSLSTVADGWRGIFIYLPEKMNVQTANMLLKSLEEPAEKTIFILITHAPEDLLPTISSRCQGIRILPLRKEEIEKALKEGFGAGEQAAALAAENSGGSLGAAIQALSEMEEGSVNGQLFSSLVESVLSGDLEGALSAAEAVVALDSREKQKAFCIFAGGAIRKMLFEGKISASFAEKALSVFSRSAGMLQRNVSQKMVFCNMATRLYVVGRKK